MDDVGYQAAVSPPHAPEAAQSSECSVLALIPARAGSRRLPGKNVMTLAGEPILVHTLRDVRAARRITQVAAVTDDPEFARLAEGLGIVVVAEPSELAADDAPVGPAIDFALRVLAKERGWRPDAVVICEPNVPVRPAGILDRAVAALLDSDAPAAYTLEPAMEHHPAWSPELIDGRVRFPSRAASVPHHQLPPRYHLSSAAYVYRRGHRWSDELVDGAVGVVHGPGECVHIDTRADADYAEFLLVRRRVLTNGRP